MDAFEYVVARLYEVQGYWVRIGYAVALSKAEKHALGQPSLPRVNLDVVAYKPGANELLVVECKSFLDSHGVRSAHFNREAAAEKDIFKLFNREEYRALVLARLLEQMREEGLIGEQRPVPMMVLVAGKVHGSDEGDLRNLFAERGWQFLGPADVAEQLRRFADHAYENDVATIVTKVLERTARLTPGDAKKPLRKPVPRE
ncbi:MAG: hypothetical protein ACYC7A_16500 [Thermoanaerobaculia bacterium]